MTRRKKVLISGAGIAGPTLAWWLHRFGFEPTVIEIAPQFRTGGYMIDFWGKGFDLIERMGLRREVERSGYHIREVRFVHSDGQRAGGFSTDGFWRATDGRFTSLPRSDLAGIIWRALPSSMESRFGEEIVCLEPEGDGVRVHFTRTQPETFDLVIGADGLHSKVRELVFGPEDRFETFLGYAFAAFTVSGYGPRTTDTYMGYGVPGRHASRVSMRDDRTLILLIWREENSRLPPTDEGRRALLKDRFVGMGWECDRMLEALDDSTDLYARQHQPNSHSAMERWARRPCRRCRLGALFPSGRGLRTWDHGRVCTCWRTRQVRGSSRGLHPL